MARKSIADLERYHGYLSKAHALKKQMCMDNVFVVGEIDTFDMAAKLAEMQEYREIMDLVHYEIVLAKLSNSATYHGEEASIYQLDLIYDRLRSEKMFFETMRMALKQEKNSVEDLRYKQQTYNMEAIASNIERLEKSLYLLREKLEKTKEKTYVDIDDMESLTPRSGSREDREALNRTEPEVIEITSME